MTHDTKHAPRRVAMPAAAVIGALALAGCSSGNIGESWQCPLAKGGSCDSVAAADPAVPDAGGRTVLGEPLWQVRGDERATVAEETSCAADCGAGFDPFAWLARLFGNDESGAEPEPATADAAPELSESPPAPDGSEPRQPDTALLPAEADREQDGPVAGDLRTGEVVARIWIGPFVDANGVYREASHVRVVLEPAGWRLK